MATYIHPNGEKIVAKFAFVSYYDAQGELKRGTDLTKWTLNAEKWIDNDIKGGYYQGFIKVGA